MSTFTKFFVILFTMVLTENYVFVQYIAICPFLGVSKNIKSAWGMGVAVVFVMTLASAATWAIYTYLLDPLGLDFMKTIVFILVIAALVQFVEMVLKKYIKPLYKALGIYLPLITTNCAVLGVTLLNIKNDYTFSESIADGLGGGLGFLLALILFCGVRRTIERSKPPKCFEGLPITLVAASLTSLTFTGFSGVVTNIFS
ncbi:MAG: electron transport complex protein RnfA [Oscillospiraceae bacterium]|jgi:electron transport complex protein RnfA